MKKAYGWIVALVLATFVITGFFLTLAPDQIPVHYNIHGEIDRWGSKYEFLLFPAISLVFGGFMAWTARYTGKKGEEFNEKVVTTMTIMVLILFNCIFAFFMWKSVDVASLSDGLGDAGAKAMLLMLTISFVPLGNILPKTTRNSLVGLRTKWSMADDVCWQKSQRFGGFLMVASGILGTVLVSLLPVYWGSYAVMGVMLVMIIGATWGSYRIYQNEHK